MQLTELINCLGDAEEITLLDYSWIGWVLLLSKVGKGKLIASPAKISSKRVFIVSLR